MEKVNLYISGESYTKSVRGGLTLRSTELSKTLLNKFNEESRLHSQRSSVTFDNRSQFQHIHKGLLKYDEHSGDFIYSYSGTAKLPLIGNRNTKVEVKLPRIIFNKEYGGPISAYSMDSMGRCRKYPLSNAFSGDPTCISPMIPNTTGQRFSSNALCLGSELDSLFHNIPMRNISMAVERIFTTNPNNDLSQLVRVDIMALKAKILELKGTPLEIKRAHLSIIAQSLSNRINRPDNESYDRLILIASVFTKIAPQFMDTFWTHCVVDNTRLNQPYPSEVADAIRQIMIL